MENLSVYSASAGSGKTFTIAYEYISMMLKAELSTPRSYRNILAVTFTNKACDEMKSRIVLNLFLISNRNSLPDDLKPQVNGIISKIKEKTGIPESDIVLRSRIFFNQIVHDYSFFSVFTIDSFFQKIVRNLAYELDMQQNYELELNTDLVISQLVDDIMLQAETDIELKANITPLIESNIEAGNKWSPKAAIKGFIVKAIGADFKGLGCDIDEYEEKINGIVKDFCVEFKKNIDGISKLIEDNELNEANFNGRGTYGRYCKLAGLSSDVWSCAKTIFKIYEGDGWLNKDKWFVQKSPHLGLSDSFNSYVNAIESLDFELFCTAYEVKQNMNLIRLLGKATDILHENLNRDSIFLLSDVPTMLSRLIGSVSDESGSVSIMPFVFESVGTKYSNFMIDEFQDTARTQWDIFHTMLQDSLSQGYDSIVVGDIKQSIYTWRGGDWSILSKLVNKDLLSEYVKPEFLDKNYRTARNIVEFNNDFFYTEYKNNLGLFGNLDSKDKAFESLYDDVWQGVTKDKDSEIKVRLYSGQYNASDNAAKVRIFNDMVSEIENLQLNYHVQPRNITILVRDNKTDGRYIANSFLSIADADRKKGVRYDVVSDEALFIVYNRAVKIILAYMRYILNNQDEISLVEASYLYYLEKNDGKIGLDFDKNAMVVAFLNDLNAKYSLAEMQSFEIVETIINRLQLNENEKNVPFLIAFRNVVHDFSEKSTDLRAFMDYWDERGNTETLKIPESQNAIRIITIHKAKGLESDYIFIPFCDWSFIGKAPGKNYIFVKDRIVDGNFLIPMSVNKNLLKTKMKDEYAANQYRETIESYNLLYVAFTRAKYGLYVSAYDKVEGDNDDKKPNISQVSHLLADYFSSESMDKNICNPQTGEVLRKRDDGWNISFDTSSTDNINVKVFTKGRLSATEDKVDVSNSDFITEYPVCEKPLMSIAHHVREDIEGDWSAVTRGTKFHSMFERIVTVDDVVPSVAVMFDNGEIDRDTYESLVREFSASLSCEPMRKWFDGSCKVY